MSGSDHDQPSHEPAPQKEQQPHKVDEKVQEDAAKERAENPGYD